MSVAEAEATRHKRRKMNKYQAETTEQVTPAAPSSSPPCTPASLPSAAPETPILGEAVAERRKERRRKRKREQVAPPPSAAQTPIHIGEEAAGMRKKKRRTRGHEQQQQPMASSPSSPTAAAGTLLEAAAAVAARKQERKRSKEPFHGQTHCVQLRGNPSPPGVGGEEADGRRGKSVKRCSSNKSRVLSTREIIRTRIELRKQQPLPQGLFHAMDMASNPSANSDSNSIQQGHGYSSPFGAFFDQFCYKPSRQDRSPPIPRTPDLLARPPPHGHLSSGSSQLMANETSKINPSKITRVSKRKQAGSASGSASLKQEKTKLKEKEMPVKEAMVKKVRKPPPLLSAAEKRSDKYRRLPLDQLVPPPRSPHRLLQEKYASDPWKVIVICMLLNLTQGKQVRKKVKGFFKRYPDAQTALNADPEKMANYLAPLGLQRVKANRIQKLSKAYVENEWTYVTELCGVGKYAADAYAIFCAGKATEVVPEDHKLVDYWKYVCFELPMIQQAQNMQEAGVTEMEHAVHKVEELAVCC